MKEPTPHLPSKVSNSNSKRAPVPGWIIALILLGVPFVIITVGLILGAHIMELVMFSILCLFGLALVFFMR
ncbi:MAG TPA: hypothetical protein PLN21_15315 [Gemmatales bacterium]|nr:hypothetical protein [Gemmatales bacterium]